MNNILLARKRICSAIAAASLLGLTLAGCSADEPAGAGERLPEGKYPITFSAAVDGLALTRATAGGTWEGGESVAIKVGGVVKEYTAKADKTLSIAAGGTPFYWQNTNSITVDAWYPYNGGTKLDDNVLTVKADQSGDGYQASDYLEVVNANVTFQAPKLTFTHRTAKVMVTLKASESVPDVSGATVKFINLQGVEGSGTGVSPKQEADGTYTAVLFPQQMQNQPFIQVTLDGHDYFYTPTDANKVNLSKGKQYTYAITVMKTGLTVTAQSITQWEGEEASVTGNAQTVTPGTNGNSVDWTPDGDGNPEDVTGNVKTQTN